MSSPIVGGVLASVGGAAVAALNFRISLRALKAGPSALASLSFVRQLLSVAYLAAAFFLARALPWGVTPLLVGAAIGLTVPSILLSLRLAKISDSLPAEPEPPAGKGDEPHE